MLLVWLSVLICKCIVRDVFYVKIRNLNKSNPRMRKMYLERSKPEGGLGLPNFMYYYWTANVSKFPNWITTFSDREGPAWSSMKLHASLPASPISLLTSPLPLNLGTYFVNPTVKNSLRIWNQFRRHLHFKQASSFSPITFNHLFLPSQIRLHF